MRGIVFCTSPIVFQAESTKTHLEETLHINSLYHNLDPMGGFNVVQLILQCSQLGVGKIIQASWPKFGGLQIDLKYNIIHPRLTQIWIILGRVHKTSP